MPLVQITATVLSFLLWNWTCSEYRVKRIAGRIWMKTLLAVLLAVLAVGSGFAQTRTAGKKEGFSKKAPAPKSMNADSVAATLNTHSGTASQLAQIEHQGVRPNAARTANHPSVAAAPRVAPAPQNRNKPMKFSYKAPHSGVTAGK